MLPLPVAQGERAEMVQPELMVAPVALVEREGQSPAMLPRADSLGT